jgi:DNA replication and repair protein RecF
VRLTQLWLTDFRCYRSLEVDLPDGVTVIVGDNGQGKTSLLEAVGWVATGRSFRGVPDAALVREGTEQAVLRAEVEHAGRVQLLEAELRAAGRNRVRVNHQPVQRRRDLLGLLRVTVFAPDDLQLVKGSPGARREYLDTLLVAITPRYEAACSDFDKVLRQRNALLRGRARDPAALDTLVVFDEQLIGAGSELVRGRLRLIDQLTPEVAAAYQSLAGDDPGIDAVYEAPWADTTPLGRDDVETQLRTALAAHRRQELDRGVTLVGPHRDEWRLRVRGLDARSHASQGEQRTLALALRLAGHRVCTEVVGEEPVLLLDDVFSELDPHRAAALVAHLDLGHQTLITTAASVPPDVKPDRRMRVAAGRVEDV